MSKEPGRRPEIPTGDLTSHASTHRRLLTVGRKRRWVSVGDIQGPVQAGNSLMPGPSVRWRKNELLLVSLHHEPSQKDRPFAD